VESIPSAGHYGTDATAAEALFQYAKSLEDEKSSKLLGDIGREMKGV
jgi:hypothetical protein